MYNRNLGAIIGLKFDFLYIIKKLKQLKRLNLELNKNDVLISSDIKMSLLLFFYAKKSKIIAIEHFEHDVGNLVLRKLEAHYILNYQQLYRKLAKIKLSICNGYLERNIKSFQILLASKRPIYRKIK